MIDIWFQFIRYSLDDTQPLPEDIERMDWAGLFWFCQEQAIAGVVFHTIEKLKNERIEIPREVLLQWFVLSEQIKHHNVLLNKRCVGLVELLKKDGFQSCILKGQGNSIMYPNPYSRNPGDIDLWVFGGRTNVTKYIKNRFPHTGTAYQHIDFPIFKDVPVEIHYLPIYVNNPFYNRRLQKWFAAREKEQCNHYVDLPDGVGKIPVPTIDFNIVYQLVHIMHHFFDEGIGLRQMIDYYYLLKSDGGWMEDISDTLKYLNLYNFAGAVMYIMKEVLGLEEKYLIVPVDERRGKTLLNEVLKGGNFGKYSGLTQHSVGAKFFLKIWRNLHFVREYPVEALCEPFFRTWHFFWRLTHR